MAAADDFINSFSKQNPQLQSGQIGLDELNRLIAIHQDKINNWPVSDFDGVSPAQMSVLLHKPLSSGCILQIKENVNDHLSKTPILMLSDLLMSQICHEGNLN